MKAEIHYSILGAAICLWLGLLAMLGCSSDPSRLRSFPKLMLWAWERPEDLRAIDPRTMGVAYLAQTLTLRGYDVLRKPRLQPLRVPHGTAMMAVTRIEVDRAMPFSPDERTREAVITELLGHLRPEVRGLQLDFDARVSERPFYRELLVELRRRMDPGMPLSMTVLASWALFDDWIRDFPVDEGVPMCFDMGADGPAVMARLRERRDFLVPLARRALGIGLREPPPWIPKNRRLYIFSHQPWDGAALDLVRKEYVQ